ncbi:MAG: bifunctional proline dehydrogenase/L-glutamate gamma-semialdehyde dehydrogenase PutA [Pseudomonadota bacterium]|jgi:RHH-type proline utilization regulon transcriptional repressor/proline dehydrogenase/delta 1-pyrroline-5-carboxylate dehydrogenase
MLDSHSDLRARIRALHRIDESLAVDRLIPLASFAADAKARIAARARELVASIRAAQGRRGGIDAFMHEYDLSSREGVVLMCLAEALLRIPDADTVDRLIRDKIGSTDWAHHVPRSDSLFVNASTWALMLTGRIVNLETEDRNLTGILKRLVARAGEPMIRQAVLAAMRILGRQFVMGRDIDEALERARGAEKQGYRHSYDMLGEAARTMADARRYFAAYEQAIAAIGREAGGRPIADAPGISVKLSALHPRYEFAKRARVMGELLPAAKALALQAKGQGIGFTIDAEEADRLELSLDVVEALALDPDLAGWQGLGLAVQAYQKRAPALIDWLADLARRANRRLLVRLVKGAYWDAEIKLAQERGLEGFPVFTRKVNTDVSYLACARKLLADPVAFYAQFATHNAHTLAAVMELAGSRTDYEFQRLHGMGEELYEQIVGADKYNRPCRVYAPVGGHEDLLAYLVRRLLENGANSSFVNRIVDAHTPIEALIADPVDTVKMLASKPHPRIALPADIYGGERRNSRGLDLWDGPTVDRLYAALAACRGESHRATPIVGGRRVNGPAQAVTSPAHRSERVGEVVTADEACIAEAVARAQAAFAAWDKTPAAERAACLERAADLMESRMPELMALIVREGGRTWPDALSEVREAVDFCRYYAARARADFAAPKLLPGPVGERNELWLHGRGVFACISPWNFPLAIFTGQVAAALAAGNTVVAKPAEQTPLIADAAVRLLHEAGIPTDVLHLLPGDGRVGAAIIGQPRIAGVAFTGSTETARLIARSLAGRDGPIVPLIAETGGQNALIADSSALPEQVVRDVLTSAFNSAGQRCSALRVLFVQADIADKLIAMLKGAMMELAVGDPAQLSTDVGPVIDAEARAGLEAHVRKLESIGRLIHRCDLPAQCAGGTFFPPQAWEIDSLAQLTREVFGPILHVIRWQSQDLDQVLAAIDATGYGLTLGIHSRIDETVERIARTLRVGNTYVNRNMIGAVVGVQPFGGERLSGTGPKAGGPHYLLRFASERTLTIDTTAAGGNATLMSIE